MATIGDQIWNYKPPSSPSYLPEGPTLNPVNPIDPGLAKFVWNMDANDIYNAAKAPIQGQTFGVSNTTLLLVGGLVVGLGLLAGRR